MKTKILAGLIVVLAAGVISAVAEDTPGQAAARAALVKKLFELNPPQKQTSPRWDAGAVVVSPDKSTNQIIEPVATKVEPPPTNFANTNLAAAPAKAVPAAVTPAVAIKPVAEPAKTPPPVMATPAPKPSPPPVVTKAPKPPVKLPPAEDLMTTTGAVYKAARVSRVESDGLIISYVPTGGGMAMTKVFFEDLPSQLRNQYEKTKEIKH